MLGLSLLGRFTPFAIGSLYLSDAGFFVAVTLLSPEVEGYGWILGGLAAGGAIGGIMVRVAENGASPAVELPVSRRQTRELRDRLVRDPMRSYRDDQ